MNYKVIAFDFDGTLRARDRSSISPQVLRALKAVQKAGIKVVLATGRSSGAVTKRMLEGFSPDYYVCANGCQVLDKNGQQLASRQMTPQEMYALVDFCEDYQLPISFSFSDGYYVYLEYQRMREFYLEVTGSDEIIRDGEDMNHHLVEMPFGAFGLIPRQYQEKFQEKYGYLDLQFFCYSDLAADITQRGVSKATGLAQLLELLGMGPEQLVAVGDGSNDAPMLRYAGLGVAMANGNQEARDAADRLCPPDVEDGAAALCRELFPEAFSGDNA